MQMVGEPQAGTVSTAQALALLLMEHPDELKKLQREGFIKPIGRDTWRLVDLVQGFARHARKRDAAAPVSSAKLAEHLCCVPSYIRKLVEMGVIQRGAGGTFALDDNRRRYIAHLREERKRSPKSEADVEFTSAKAQLIRIRIDEKRRTLVHRDEYEAMIDQLAGLTLTKLGAWPAGIAGTDLALRRKAEALLRKLRIEMSQAATALADEEGEPSLEEQAALAG
jgi:hypothetical protein